MQGTMRCIPICYAFGNYFNRIVSFKKRVKVFGGILAFGPSNFISYSLTLYGILGVSKYNSFAKP
jgi:hypothetical protein